MLFGVSNPEKHTLIAELKYEYPEFKNNIDGFGKEDTWYYDNTYREQTEIDFELQYLDEAIDDGKFVLAIDYLTQTPKITDFYNPNVIRASIGHMFTMNLISDTTSNIIDMLNINSYQIILMDPDSEYLLKDFKAKENFALVIGSEQYGISDKWLNTDCVKLKIESLL